MAPAASSFSHPRDGLQAQGAAPRIGRRGSSRTRIGRRGSSRTTSSWPTAAPIAGLRSRIEALTAELDAHDPINIQFTSGTTGLPLGYQPHTTNNIVNSSRFIGHALALPLTTVSASPSRSTIASASSSATSRV